jgi:hypothetical protein
LEKVHIYAVNRESALESVEHTSIDFLTGSRGIEFGFGALRKGKDGSGIVTLVGATYEAVLKTQCTECFSAACDERYNAMF